MLDTPRKYTLVAAGAEGPTRLNAFDNALLRAGIGNLNLLRISSVLPAGATRLERVEIEPASLVPTAYGVIHSEKPDELISAAIGVGVAADGGSGIIMEFSGRCSRAEAESSVRFMVEQAFVTRGRPLEKVEVLAVEHRVEKNGCAFAAAALWY